MPAFLADAIFWIAVACCVIAQVAILHSVLVSPAPRQASADNADKRARAAFSMHRAVEILWAVLPGFALTAVLVFTWRAIHGPSV
jgi:heme/copper-type cytochrome/quinol oxidase subunit 2